MSRRASIRLGERNVGELVERPDGIVEFQFAEAYSRLFPRPVLGQLFEDDLTATYRGKKERSQLPAYFANMLPEGRLRSLLESRGGIPERDDLGLLVLLGRDLPGAVVVDSPTGEARTADDAFSPGNGDDDTTPLRFSLAGVQMKFSVVHERDKLTLPARDKAGDSIVKLHGPQLPGLAQNEYSMMEWARESGFEVPACSLWALGDLEGLPIDEVDPEASAFVIRRYDREGELRLHQEDFAQVVGLWPSLKYDHLTYEKLGILVQRIVGDDGFIEYMRRIALMVATGNGDAHAKNWSLIYRDGIRPALAPLYDQVFTGAWPRLERVAGQTRRRVRSPELALKLLGMKHFGSCDSVFFERLGAKVGQPLVAREVARETLSRLRSAWARVSEALPMFADHKDLLRSHWSAVPCLREHGPLG